MAIQFPSISGISLSFFATGTNSHILYSVMRESVKSSSKTLPIAMMIARMGVSHAPVTAVVSSSVLWKLVGYVATSASYVPTVSGYGYKVLKFIVPPIYRFSWNIFSNKWLRTILGIGIPSGALAVDAAVHGNEAG